MAVIFSSWAHVAHAIYKPWGVTSPTYRVQHLSLFVTTFVFTMGLLFKVQGVYLTGSYLALSVIMLLLCIVFGVLWTHEMTKGVWTALRLRHERRKNDKGSSSSSSSSSSSVTGTGMFGSLGASRSDDVARSQSLSAFVTSGQTSLDTFAVTTNPLRQSAATRQSASLTTPLPPSGAMSDTRSGDVRRSTLRPHDIGPDGRVVSANPLLLGDRRISSALSFAPPTTRPFAAMAAYRKTSSRGGPGARVTGNSGSRGSKAAVSIAASSSAAGGLVDPVDATGPVEKADVGSVCVPDDGAGVGFVLDADVGLPDAALTGHAHASATATSTCEVPVESEKHDESTCPSAETSIGANAISVPLQQVQVQPTPKVGEPAMPVQRRKSSVMRVSRAARAHAISGIQSLAAKAGGLKFFGGGASGASASGSSSGGGGGKLHSKPRSPSGSR